MTQRYRNNQPPYNRRQTGRPLIRPSGSSSSDTTIYVDDTPTSSPDTSSSSSGCDTSSSDSGSSGGGCD